MSMSTSPIAVDPPNLDPGIMKYLQDPPPPRSAVDEGDFSNAFNHLDQAARLAVAKDAAGNRWVPGLSIVVVRPDAGILRAEYHCYGTKNIDKDTAAPVGADTLFPCASLSKPVSTSLLVAASLPKIFTPPNWDAPVRKAGAAGPLDFYHLTHSPQQEFARHWLSHLSGMPGHAGDLIEDINPDMPRDELLDRVQRYQNGIVLRTYHYANMGFTMGCLGAAWELGSADWEAFARSQLNELGMSRSTYSFVSVYHDTSDRAFPHQGQPDSTELLKIVPKGWAWHVVSEADERNPSRQAPAGSLLSSARDLGQFLTAHLADKFGREFPPKTMTPPEEKYALGWNVSNDKTFPPTAKNAISFNHSGAFRQGAGTFLRFDPGMGVGIAVLSNGEPTGVPEALGMLFFKTLYGVPLPPGRDHAALLANVRAAYMYQLYEEKIANNEKYRAAPRVPIPPRITTDNVFSGHSEYFGCDFTIRRRTPLKPTDSGLYLMMGKDKNGQPFLNLPLACIEDSPSSSTFVYETKGENEVGWSAVRCVWQGNTVTQIVIDWLNGQGPDLGVINRSK